MNKKDKKAYIKTLEAIVAILLIYLFIAYLLKDNKPKQATAPIDIKLTQESILKEIQSSNYYRNCVLINNSTCVNDLINSTIANKYNYAFSLCTKSQCYIPITPAKDVYLSSVIISANITDYSTTSINLYVWRKI
ncbi:hypothetical protein HYX18_02745 [Candidatus Woesearchaeota archaeon]|nr:hypothetical protein [Candidatus Woesearchaeota archaeon]